MAGGEGKEGAEQPEEARADGGANLSLTMTTAPQLLCEAGFYARYHSPDRAPLAKSPQMLVGFYQHNVVATLLPGAKAGVQKLGELLAWFDLPTLPPWLCTVTGVRTFEGQAAGLYFGAWKGHPLQWRKSARRYVPPHWQTIRERHLPLSDSARRAVDPANAILDYAYGGVLEGQCRQALAAEGFDLACGFLHADKQYRDSLVYDLMELYRPAVDALVLAFLGRTTFAYGDMVCASNGQCMLHPQLARAVVAACRLDQERGSTGARQLREMLVESVVSTRPIL